MNLIICPSCLKLTSSKSPDCLKCGHPMPIIKSEIGTESQKKPIKVTIDRKKNSQTDISTIINSKKCPLAHKKPIHIEVGYQQTSTKDWWLTLFLCLFFGIFGFHRLYTGKIFTGILQFLSMGFFGIWTFIDLLLILFGAFKDAEGLPIKRQHAIS